MVVLFEWLQVTLKIIHIIGECCMDKISYFKLQAKNLFRDFKTQQVDGDGIYFYSPRFYDDIDDLILSYDIDENHFTLMNAQHLIANLAGFNNWCALLHASDAALELGQLLLENRNRFCWPVLDGWDWWLNYSNLQDESDETKVELFREFFMSRKN